MYAARMHASLFACFRDFLHVSMSLQVCLYMYVSVYVTLENRISDLNLNPKPKPKTLSRLHPYNTVGDPNPWAAFF